MKKNTVKISTMVFAAILAASTAITPVYASITKYPDINGHWAEKIVTKWAEANVVSGYPDGMFKPDDLITRAEFGVWVYKLFGYQQGDGDSNFDDVEGHWAESIITSLVEHGVIVNSEYGDNYGPDVQITRMEMIRMMVRAIDKQSETPDAVGATAFLDDAGVLRSDSGFINVASKYEIIAGYPDGTLKPYARATRAEGAAMLVKLQKIAEEQAQQPEEEPEKEEVKKTSSSGGGGGSHRVSPATIDFTLATSTYVSDTEPVIATVTGASSVQWKLMKDGVQVDMDTYATAVLAKNGGEIVFKEAGEYELIGIAKNSRGMETTQSKKISVYPNAEMRMTLPDTTHTDRTAPIELLIEKIGDPAVEWTIVDSTGKEIALSDVAVGEMNGKSGLLQFRDAGEYTITAKVKDEHGKEFSTAQTIKVYPVVDLSMDVQPIRHTDETETITLQTENLGDLNVVWTVTSNGTSVELSEIATGELSNTGGLLEITTPGSYVFTASVTDETGREYTETKSITVYPVGDVIFTLPMVFHTDTEVTVDAEFTELADNQITWTLLQNGTEVNIADYITGSLTETGGKIHVTQKGGYTLKASFTDAGGRTYEHEQAFKVYGIPEITMTMPKTAHTDTILDLEASVSEADGCKVVWLVDNTYGFQDWATFIDGVFAADGGDIRFKHAGVYQFVAQVTDPTGRVFVFDTFGKCEVYPALDLRFNLPTVLYIDTTTDIKTTGNIFSQPIDWTVVKDENDISLQDAVNGTLNETGGRINFTDTGEYTLQASITDATGRVFSYSQDTRVLPLITFDISVGSEVKKNVPTSVTSGVENIGDNTVVWTLEKDGVLVELEDYIDGVLDNDGCRDIIFKEKGDFKLIATATDETGRVFTGYTDFTVTLMPPNDPEGIAYPTRQVKDQMLYVDFDVNIDNPYQLDIHYEWQDMPEDQYFTLGTHTVQVRAVNEDGMASNWVPVQFTLTNRPPSRPTIEGKPTGSSGNYIDPSQVVTLSATGSKDPDGDEIHYVWENYNGTGQTYSNGKQLVKVKAVDTFGAESSQAAILFFVADESGGGMTLADSTSFIHEPGIPGATITNWTYNVPAVPGHSGSDYGLVEAYNQNTKRWEQIDKVTTSNGVTMSGNLTPGVYTEMRFTYYTNHNCMYNKSNITYTVDFYFPEEEYSSITLTMPNTAYVGDTVTAQVTTENMTDQNLTWSVEKGGADVPLSDVMLGDPSNSGSTFRFTQAGAYTVTVTGKDSDGNDISDSHMISVYNKTSLTMTLAEKAMVDEQVQAKLTTNNLGTNSVEWSVEKDGQDIPLSNVTVGTPDNTGGIFQFSEPGIYTVKTVVTDKGGGVTIDYKEITVYPAAKLEVNMNDSAYTGETVSVDIISENLGAEGINWRVEKDGQSIDLDDVTQSVPDNNGGEFIFTEAGEYTITVTGTDEGGKEIEQSHTITVYDKAGLHLNMPDNGNTGEDIKATLTTDNTDTSNVEWSVTKDGQPIDISDVTTAEPDQDGAEFHFTDPGTYVITVTTTDPAGNEVSETHTIIITAQMSEETAISMTMPEKAKTGEAVPVTVTVTGGDVANVKFTATTDIGENYYITNNGNGSYEFEFPSPGTYDITAVTTDANGNEITTTESILIYSSVVPKVSLIMPEYTHTDKVLQYTNTDKNFYGYTVEWFVYDETGEVDWNTYIDGQFDGASGTFRFKKPGVYTLHAKVTGPEGDVWTYDDFDSCRVYKYYFFEVVLLPEEIWTDKYSFTYGTKGNASEVSDQMEWTISIDGDTISLGDQDEFNAFLEKHGAGEYTVTCSYTDEVGREFSNTATLTVNTGSPAISLDIEVDKETAQVNEDVVVTTTLENADGLNVEWTVIKDGAEVGYEGFMTGTLGNDGGTIQFTESGRYNIRATITDDNGVSYTANKFVEVTGISAVAMSLMLEEEPTEEDMISLGGITEGETSITEDTQIEELPEENVLPDADEELSEENVLPKTDEQLTEGQQPHENESSDDAEVPVEDVKTNEDEMVNDEETSAGEEVFDGENAPAEEETPSDDTDVTEDEQPATEDNEEPAETQTSDELDQSAEDSSESESEPSENDNTEQV